MPAAPRQPRLKAAMASTPPSVAPPPTREFSFLTLWMNDEHNRVVITQGGSIFISLILHMQREQAGERELTPDKLEAYNDIIELITKAQQRFPSKKS